MKFKCCFALLISAVLITGCDKSTGDAVSFSPKVGDTHTYNIHTAIQAKIAGHTSRVERIVRANYKLAQNKDNQLKFDLDFDYYRMHFPGRSMDISSDEISDGGSEKIRRIYASGFELIFDNKTQQLVDFYVKNQKLWQDLKKRATPNQLELLKKGFYQPGFIDSIPAKVNAKVSIHLLNDQQVELTVDKVTTTQIFAHFETVHNAKPEEQSAPAKGQKQSAKQIYGEVILNRQSTWIDSMTIVQSQPIERYGYHGKLMLYTSIESKSFARAPSRGDIYDEPIYFDYSKNTPKTTIKNSQPLAYAQGSFAPQSSSNYQLIYSYPLVDRNTAGKVTLSDIQAFDKQGSPLNIHYWTLYHRLLQKTGINATLEYNLAPLGWAQSGQQKPQISSFKATANFYPRTLTTQNVQLPDDKPKTVTVGQLKITMTPLGKKGSYLVHSAPSDNRKLLAFFNGLQGKMTFLRDKDLPEWLGDDGYRLFNQASYPHSSDFKLELAASVKNITFNVATTQTKPSQTRSIKFITPKAYFANPYNPVPLMGNNENMGTPMNKNLAYSQIKIIQDQGQSLALEMPKELASVCHLTIQKGFTLNNHPIQWQRQPSNNDSDDGIARYQLTTDDGIRRYFYGHQVKTAIHCSALPHWQEIKDFKTNDKAPWLIDIASLGKDFSSSQSAQSVKENFHFLDSQGRTIAILSNNTPQILKGDDPLSDALVDNKWLRLSSVPEKVFHLGLTSQSYDQTWTTHFAPLP
ncbi:hypothetical protein [Celerinatantimonas sp. MCCC 1A17872]|uniref:hypothetical protein n=1 Tax=Celerinatantimonas sp. MCCC 1A17872 TaxID=3177514 RepID=UPI0038C16D6D